MEYVYSALLLHKAGKKVDEPSVKKVLEAVDVKVDDARVKALVAALDGVDIDKAVEKAAMAPVAVAQSPTEQKAAPKEDKKKKEEESKQSEEQAAAGLGALFG